MLSLLTKYDHAISFSFEETALCKINSADEIEGGFHYLHMHLLKMTRCHLTVDIYNAEFMVSWFGTPFQPLCPLFQSFPVCLAFEPCVPYIQEGWSFYILQNVHEAPVRG